MSKKLDLLIITIDVKPSPLRAGSSSCFSKKKYLKNN